MKAKLWFQLIKRPAIWVTWIEYGLFSLTLQTICYSGTQPLSPAGWKIQVVQVLYFIYLVWTVILLIYWVKSFSSDKKKATNLIAGLNINSHKINGKSNGPDRIPSSESSSTEISASTAAGQQDAEQDATALASDYLQKLLELFESGKTGQALIQRVDYTGDFIGPHPFLKLHVLIRQNKRTPLRLMACALVNKNSIPRIGDHCTIRYLPQVPSTLAILDILQPDMTAPT